MKLFLLYSPPLRDVRKLVTEHGPPCGEYRCAPELEKWIHLRLKRTKKIDAKSLLPKTAQTNPTRPFRLY